jgi:ATP-dependent DNA helicase RecG
MEELKKIALKGEDSKNQFKADIKNADSLAAEIIFFDEVPAKAGIDKIDKIRFREFLKKNYKINMPETDDEFLSLLKNMNLANDEACLNLAGVLLFAENPEWIKPEFIVKAVSYPGKDVCVSEYIDSEDFYGPIKNQFDESLAFIMRNLKKNSGRTKCKFYRKTRNS